MRTGKKALTHEDRDFRDVHVTPGDPSDDT
jgi:hypothetical protein